MVDETLVRADDKENLVSKSSEVRRSVKKDDLPILQPSQREDVNKQLPVPKGPFSYKEQKPKAPVF